MVERLEPWLNSPVYLLPSEFLNHDVDVYSNNRMDGRLLTYQSQ
jgi:hypothetical protein